MTGKHAKHPRIGRPPRTAEQEAALRGRAIAAARRLFAEHGFEGVSMRRIAAEAGCAAMTLYDYFHSKNEILRYIWEDFFAELFARVEAAAARRGTPAQKLRRVAAVYLDYWFEYPDRYRMIYLNEDRAGEGERHYVDASDIVGRYAILRELIVAAQAAGQARTGDPQLLAETLVCVLQGIAHSLITIPEYPWRARSALLAQGLAAVLLDGGAQGA